MAELPEYHGAMLRRLGIIEDMGRSATQNTRSRMLNRAMPGNGITSSRAAGAPRNDRAVTSNTLSAPGQYKNHNERITAFGKILQGMGYRVAEHPNFGGVAPVHKGRGHYEGRALDVNWAPGTSKAEQDKLRELLPLIQQWGLMNIFMKPGHYGHIHIESR